MKGLFIPFETLDNKFIVMPDTTMHEQLLELVPYEKRNCYNVVGARLCGLQYADYLRFCRDEYGAVLRGKNHKYPLPAFDTKEDCIKLCTFLSERWSRL